ncbi:MAG: AtpZ/AtpI family protein [Anaerolineaceae bacterium]|nr:AtpZ/AtpI family protein [Anaerolineaceae bacterium]
MSEENFQSGKEKHRAKVIKQVQRKSARHQRARQNDRHGMYFGLGMFGMVGWSVAVPTILGLILGIWIDRTWPGQASWTLMGLLAGIILGCYNAWYWVKKESSREAYQPPEEEEHDEHW